MMESRVCDKASYVRHKTETGLTMVLAAQKSGALGAPIVEYPESLFKVSQSSLAFKDERYDDVLGAFGCLSANFLSSGLVPGALVLNFWAGWG
jgi:hypothetical protein